MFPLLASHGLWWASGQRAIALRLSCSPCIQNADSQGPKLFFFGSLAVAVGSASFFPLLFPQSLPNSQTLQYIPSRNHCCWCRFAAVCFCFSSLQISLAPSSGRRDQNNPAISAAKRYLNPQGNESLSVHPNCTFQGSLGSSRLGTPNSSQTVSVSSPQSRSSSSASPASLSPLTAYLSVYLSRLLSLSLSRPPIRIRLRFCCLLFLLSRVSIAWR